VFRRDVVDAVVLGGPPDVGERAASLLARYPGVPLFVAGPFGPGDGATLARYRRAGVQGILVDGVDDAAAAELVATRTASRARRPIAEPRGRDPAPARSALERASKGS